MIGFISPWQPKVIPVPSSRLPDPLPPPKQLDAPPSSSVVWPSIASAVEWLLGQNVLTRAQLQAVRDRSGAAGKLISDETAQRFNDRLAKSLAESLDLGESAAQWRTRAQGMALFQRSTSETIHRTFTHRAYNNGQRAILDGPAGVLFPYVLYSATHDARTRPEHRKQDGKVAGKNSPTADYWRRLLTEWNCLLPGNKIEGTFDIGSRVLYHGKAVEVKTLGGSVIRVTEHHPVLTSHGWVYAGMLKEGDKLLRHVREREIERIPFSPAELDGRASEKKNDPSSVEDVFSSLSAIGVAKHSRAEAGHFHGDADGFNSDVDIVGAYWKLLSRRESGSDDAGNVVLELSFLGLMSGHDLPGDLGLTHPTPFDGFRFGLTSKLDAALFEASRDSRSTDAGSVGNGLYRLAGNVCRNERPDIERGSTVASADAGLFQPPAYRIGADPELISNLMNCQAGIVALDDVVDVNVFDFSGHVYDFQSSTGAIVAEGVIIANCRCGLVPVSEEDAHKYNIVDEGGVPAEAGRG